MVAPHSFDRTGDMEAAKRRLRLLVARQRREGDLAALLERLSGVLSGSDGAVGFVWPLAGEPDLRSLMERLDDEGRVVLLPVVTDRGRPLEFRRWRRFSAMERGPLGTVHPAAGPAVSPDLILVPLMAFDSARNRLGRGGGFYDRTLAAWPGARSVGFAFEWARVDAVPVGPHDRRLDLVVTDRGSV